MPQNNRNLLLVLLASSSSVQATTNSNLRGSTTTGPSADDSLSYPSAPAEETLSRTLQSYSNAKLDTDLSMRRTCVFFTAPHSMYLNDISNGGRYKQAESYTDDIARAMARKIGGGYATWKNDEKTDAKRRNDQGRALDKNNRDPNFLGDKERTKYGWMKAIHEAKRNCRGTSTRKPGGLHVDVHGMSESSAKMFGQHFIVGFRAMETQTNGKDGPRTYKKGSSLKFRQNLAARLKPVLAEICPNLSRVDGRRLGCKVAIGYKEGSTGYSYKSGNTERFVGDWNSRGWKKERENQNKSRNTMTRLSTEKRLWKTYRSGSHQPFGCAVQVEMSPSMRKFLKNNPRYSEKLAEKFKLAFRDTGCTEGTPASASS